MRLLQWNICHGGGKRIDKIIPAILDHQPDIIVLCEFRQTNGNKICSALVNAGWHCLTSQPNGRVNGLLIATKQQLKPRPQHSAAPAPAVRWLEASVAGTQWSLAALHIPLNEPKEPFWKAALQMASERGGEPCVFVGDFNTGKHHVDEVGATFQCSQYLEKLETIGWVEAWRHLNPTKKEYSWYSKKGNGFRLDLAYISSLALPLLQSASYSHKERENGTSDHSILLVELAG